MSDHGIGVRDMRTRFVLTIAVLVAVVGAAYAVKITGFTDTDRFIERMGSIVIAECLSVPPEGRNHYDDGVYPVKVRIERVLKGDKKHGPANITTIYPMEVGRKYLLASHGWSGDHTDIQAIPQLTVVQLPRGFDEKLIREKPLKEQITIVFEHGLAEANSQIKYLQEQRALLEKALGKTTSRPAGE
jgi:hypothetical protein